MAISDRSVLCAYRYDPLDRLADCLAAGQGSARFFYQRNRLATQIQGQIQHSLLRTDEHLLAQRRTENNQSDSALLLTDQQQSVIAAQGLALAYTPYGHRHPSAGPMNLPGFTGQRVDPVTGHYLLGNGYRAFNPVLMRFNSPDSLSPFDEGGLNAYAYCEGDPVNRVDPSGHVRLVLQNTSRRGSSSSQTSLTRRISQASRTPAPVNTSSVPPAPQGSVDFVLGQTSSQPRSMALQLSTDLANPSAGPLPSMPRLPSVAPPTYMSSQSGIHDSYIFDPPPQYTRFESSVPFTETSGANANNSRVAPVPTRLDPALVRMNRAIRELEERGVWD
ncbi:hypothetical protein A244_08290 [Pseudomonas syringae pv. actinidiae ICMP 18807]|uniref:Teneurin-like YD-shell domain-containing protein n=1 Tax=Pseudomonas syringae pv. actinidiae ICMP 18807 TaxID=1194404 RepID=S6UZS7_PSESF|nr:RHS repeat-associated core domain-containing protein [Pseudomonas syringae]EPN59970.1 hypothetical protein A244_08290 [Pseudomonas syringae pv. actinidiae ICMP 18807]